MDLREADFSIVMASEGPRPVSTRLFLDGYFARSPLDKQVKRSSLSLERPLGCLIKKKNQSSCYRGHLISSFCAHSRRWAHNTLIKLPRVSSRSPIGCSTSTRALSIQH